MAGARDDIQNLFSDPEALREIMSWTDEQLTEAYTEAQERKNKQYTDVVVFIHISNQGEVKIDFAPEITYPSYMLRAFDDFIDSQVG